MPDYTITFARSARKELEELGEKLGFVPQPNPGVLVVKYP